MTRLTEKHFLLVLCILGSLVRFIYGAIYEPWSQAPDHLAWEIILEQGSFRYDHLIHYPHEGGTILVSLISQLFELFTQFSSLTITAFLLDFLVRFVQLKIVHSVFGRNAAIWFGIWTIFAAPSILPWATVNFGLHSIASIFPFLLIYLLSLKNTSFKHSIICGAFLGIAFWFSYINLVLIPVYFLFRMATREKWRNVLYSFLSLSVVLILHFFVRKNFDAGFHLQGLDVSSIRGKTLIQPDLHFWIQIREIPNILANSAFGIPRSNTFMQSLHFIYFGAIVLAIVGFFLAYRKGFLNKLSMLIFSIVALFMLLYVIGPFYYSNDAGTHVSYRHLTYILPLFSLFVILGLNAVPKINVLLLIVFLGIGAFRSIQLFTLEKPKPNDIFLKAAGWTIGTKFGHDSMTIKHVLEKNPQRRKLLSEGIGWGMSTALFEDLRMEKNGAEIEKRVTKLFKIIDQLPTRDKENLNEGIKFSFSDQVSPRLDVGILVKYENRRN